MDEAYAQYLLKKTTQDYNLIADHFARTREWIWQEVIPLAGDIWDGERVLDLGCGNGRLLELFREKGIDYVGVDSSEKLIEIAKKKYQPAPSIKKGKGPLFRPAVRFLVANALNLPLPDNFFHKVFSLAVLHHIPSEKFRLQFLKEVRRVLREGGQLILSVWNLWSRKATWKLLLKYTFLKLIGKSKLDFKDIFYPWKSPRGQIIVQRYIHCFTKPELKNLVQKSGFKVKEIWIWPKGARSNIYLVAEK